MDSRFLFKQDYEEEEMRERIHSDYFDSDIPLVQNAAAEAGLTEDELGSKSDIVTKLRSRLDEDRYKEFIQDLFNKYGKRGEKFNFQLYYVGDSIDIDKLVDNAEAYNGTYIEDTSIPTVIKLEDVNSENENTIDFLFLVEGSPEMDLADEFAVQMGEKEKELTEIEEIDEQALLKKQNDYNVEARYYTDRGLIGISNSDGSDKIRDSLVNTIKESLVVQSVITA
jgi:hypothetical protein